MYSHLKLNLQFDKENLIVSQTLQYSVIEKILEFQHRNRKPNNLIKNTLPSKPVCPAMNHWACKHTLSRGHRHHLRNQGALLSFRVDTCGK